MKITCEICGNDFDPSKLDEVIFHENHQLHVVTGITGVRKETEHETETKKGHTRQN